MSVDVIRLLRLLACVNRVADEPRRSQSEPQDWSARWTAGTAFEALRFAARRGDPNARVALDAFVASLAIKDASRTPHAFAGDIAAPRGIFTRSNRESVEAEEGSKSQEQAI